MAVTGFCMGGALACLAAAHVQELDCAVIWYGYPSPDLMQGKKIKIPLLGHFALHDEAFDIGGVDELEKKLKKKKQILNFLDTMQNMPLRMKKLIVKIYLIYSIMKRQNN